MENKFLYSNLRRQIPLRKKIKFEFLTMNGLIMAPNEDFFIINNKVKFANYWKKSNSGFQRVGIFYTKLKQTL